MTLLLKAKFFDTPLDDKFVHRMRVAQLRIIGIDDHNALYR